jgi:DNA-binding XRE family transcriptional regulator
MIRTEAEYREAQRRMAEGTRALAKEKERLEKSGLGAEEVERVLMAPRSFLAEIEDEVGFYERLQRGEIDEIENLHGLGLMLIALRIARGLTQRQLAERLGVPESQVSRDEHNEYHEVTVERAVSILDALGVRMKSLVETPIELEPASAP